MSINSFTFQAYGFVYASEDFAGGYSNNIFGVHTMWNPIKFDILPALLQQAETLEAILPESSVAVGSSFGPRVDMHAHDPCVLYGTLNFSDYNNDYPVTATAPSLSWIVEHLPDLKNPDPLQAWRVGDLLVWAEGSCPAMLSPHAEVYSVDFTDFDEFSGNDQETAVKWLNWHSLVDVLGVHGLDPDSEEWRDAARALFIKRVADVVSHPDPMKLIVAYFGEKQAAMLRLKGVI